MINKFNKNAKFELYFNGRIVYAFLNYQKFVDLARYILSNYNQEEFIVYNKDNNKKIYLNDIPEKVLSDANLFQGQSSLERRIAKIRQNVIEECLQSLKNSVVQKNKSVN